ncbi:MAG: hypothetical protein R3342_00020 [Lutibacter sp.]|uniref:hypothetical protein n=1 Tax=Lutibacter sp. TaxID=1925666 RepID=UPI00299EC1D3|nr:hypothetical protein [Lutibacter sp.]MDX1827906.1 hypothetical protein [Lutibacter sp.]
MPLISTLLGGFSIAIIANLLISELNTRLSRSIMIIFSLAASFFLVNVIAMNSIIMRTTKGYPLRLDLSDISSERIIGMVSLFFGILSLLTILSLAGFTKSKKTGKITTGIGIIALVLILIVM